MTQPMPALSKAASSPGLRRQSADQVVEWMEINREADYELKNMNVRGHETDLLMDKARLTARVAARQHRQRAPTPLAPHRAAF